MRGTRTVIADLRREGFDVSWGYVSYLCREGFPVPEQKISGVLVWEDDDVQRLRWALERRNRGPTAGRGRDDTP